MKFAVFAIDPGPTKSGFVVWDGENVLHHGIEANDKLLIEIIPQWYLTSELVVERIMSYGMAVSTSIFDTVFWSGRFCERWASDGNTKWSRVPRMDVKMHICHSSKAKDTNIYHALLDRFEPDMKPRCRPKGIMKGLKGDSTQAFALAVYYLDRRL